MERTPEGKEAWKFICAIVAPVLPKVTTKTQIKAAAYVAFKVGGDWPASRIDEAADERLKAPTLNRIKERAYELGLAEPSPWLKQEGCTDGELIARLRHMRLNAHGATADVLDETIQRLSIKH